MGDPITTGAAITAGGSLLGGFSQGYGASKAAEAQSAASKYGTDIQNQISQRNLAAEQALNAYNLTNQENLADTLRNAYQNNSNRYSTGETNLANLYSQSPEALQTLKQQALTGQAKELQQGTNQLQAALASAGVRGGQAATQMRRGIGEMTQNTNENINKLIANEAIQRAAEKRQYIAGQQSNLQNFMLNNAGYSQPQTETQNSQLAQLLKNYLNIGKIK